MGDIYIGRNEDGELTHSAKGTTWSKDGASYIKREKKNGKWVYTYRKLGKSGDNGQPVDTTNSTPSSEDVSKRQRFAQNEAKTSFTISNRRAQQIQSEAESMKRKSVSAQRNIEKDPRYKVEAKAAYLKNKASRAARKNVAKGKKKVSEILSRLRKSAKKAKKKIQNAVSVKETAYITDVSTGKRRPAPTDLFDNAKTMKRSVSVTQRKKKNVANRERDEKRRKEENLKKYKKQANIQKALNKGLQSKSKAYKKKRAAEARKEKVNSAVNTVKNTLKKDSDALRAENKHQQEYAKKTAKKREQLRKMNKRKS